MTRYLYALLLAFLMFVVLPVLGWCFAFITMKLEPWFEFLYYALVGFILLWLVTVLAWSIANKVRSVFVWLSNMDAHPMTRR